MPKPKRALNKKTSRPKAPSRTKQTKEEDIPIREVTILPPGEYQAQLCSNVLSLQGNQGQSDIFRLSWGIRGLAFYRGVVDSEGNIDLHPQDVDSAGNRMDRQPSY